MRRMKWSVALVALVGCTSPDLEVTSGNVVGGQVTLPGAFPGVGALMYDVGGGTPQFGCTGTLIAPNVVLTAAHCLDPDLVGPSTPGFTLALDTTTVTPPTVVPGLMAIKHEMFTLETIPEIGLGEFFDVGVVILAQAITEVPPVMMPRPADSPELVAGLQMQIAGYGATDAQGNGGGVMFDATTALISLNPSEIQVGMGAPQPQNCYGDSGGPGFATVGGMRRVIGVVSRSFDGGECSTGGVDSRVDSYLTWIHSKLPPGTAVPCGSGLAEACVVPEPEPEPEPEDDGDDLTDDAADTGDGDEEGGGCCSTGGDGTGSVVLGLGLGLIVLRRRRTP